MKKIAIASAITLASISAAHAMPTVYGKAVLGVDYINTDNETASDTKQTLLQSHVSRIGFKGDEELTENTDLVYQLEYGINIDDNSPQFNSRNTFLGLANRQYGTLLAGRHDTPFKLSKGSVAQFEDYKETDLGKVLSDEVRANNVLAYKSPAIVGYPVTFMAAVALSENDDSANKVLKPAVLNADGTVKTEAVTTSEAKQKDNAYSASLAYDQNGVYVAGAYDSNVVDVDNAWRITGALDMGKMNLVQGLTLGAMYQNANIYNKSEDEQSLVLSGKYKIGETPWAIKAQYATTENYKGVKDDKATEIALGGEYSFNKATKAHMYVAQINKDYKLGTKDEDKTIVGTALEYKF
ncbi:MULTISPECIES: porin [unclassified Moraxella]|uniref:porin n=1 Tax=unclassified Moraxella TaxID=2685852 RepID=UPI003AF637D6